MALLGIASCANGQNGKTDMKGKKILVAYYSWGGNTKAVGDYIAQKTGADVCRIEPVKAYPTDYEACVNEVNRHGSTYEPLRTRCVPFCTATRSKVKRSFPL